ncbi:MAG: hypothetical protein ACR2RA_17710 [Geminicoccaceae bacterium]
MDRIAALSTERTDETPSGEPQTAEPSKTTSRDWGQHPLNLRVTLPLPFRCWYITLVAGPEKRATERLVAEREKHPLDTLPNAMFLLSIGIVTSTLMLLVAALVLIHGFGWSVDLTIPA